jgi:DNA replication and repair protein RecF
MTGADPAAFAEVGLGGDVFNVEAGQISRRA